MKTLKQELFERKIVLKKKFGQNFLTDETLLLKIVSESGVNDSLSVLEIGCGAGALTKVLCENAKSVLGYEIDETLKPLLSDKLSGFDNVEIVYKDVLKDGVKAVEKKIGGKYALIANLPYYITTPIVMEFLENAENLEFMTVMVQEEVADRFCATEKNSDYGAITVGINLRGKAEKLFKVGREKFTPAPNVDSAVVKITLDNGKFKNADLKEVRKVVRGAFSSRRKTLVNNLMLSFKLPRAVAESVVLTSGFPLTVRGEELSAEDFVRLTDVLGKING